MNTIHYFATCLVLFGINVNAQETMTLASLGNLNSCQLEDLYKSGKVFTPKDGYLKGKAFPKPDKLGHKLKSNGIGLIWKGKNIYASEGVMLNQVGKKEKVAASISTEESWLDGKPSVIFDYANGPKWAQKARDEVREISPGLYLGIMYYRDCPAPKQAMFFALEACNAKP